MANVLTGLINLTIPTMYTSDVWAMIILVLYSITLCGVHPFFCDYFFGREDEAIKTVVDEIFYIPIFIEF